MVGRGGACSPASRDIPELVQYTTLLDIDEVTTRKEVCPSIHLWRLNSDLRQARSDLRAVFGPMVYRLQKEERHRHPPCAGRVITGDLDLPIVPGQCRRCLELRIAMNEALNQQIEPGEGLIVEPLWPFDVEQARCVSLLCVRYVNEGAADASIRSVGAHLELLWVKRAACFREPVIHQGVMSEELHDEIHLAMVCNRTRRRARSDIDNSPQRCYGPGSSAAPSGGTYKHTYCCSVRAASRTSPASDTVAG